MQSQPRIDNDLQRVILLRSYGAEILVRHDGGRLDLPAVPIPRHQRVAENLTAFLRREWSQDAVSLFALNPSSAECQRRYQVTESTAAQRSAIAGFRWVSVSSLEGNRFEHPDDCTAIARALAQCEEYATGRAHGPFAQLGWFAELTEWVRDRIRPAGLVFSGRFTQLNASPTFSLVRFETNGPAAWFKAVGEPNLREYPITLALAQYFPAFVPRVIATREDWNGWLAVEVAGAHPAEDSGIGVWRRVAKTLAELQAASIGQTLHLLNTGCRDARVCTLLGLTEPFFEVMADVMEQQAKQPPAPLSRNELLTLRMQIQDVLMDASHSQIPNTIGHFDLNPGNILASYERCTFLDWAEGCAGPPCLTFRYLLEHVSRLYPQGDSMKRVLASAYVNRWRNSVSTDQIAKALRLSPLLAVFAYAACGDAFRDPNRLQRPETSAYLRSLTRRMKREADLFSATETRKALPCLS